MYVTCKTANQMALTLYNLSQNKNGKHQNDKMAIDAGCPISRVRESWKVCQSWQQQQERIVCIGYNYATFHKQTLLCHKVNSCKLHGSREWWSLSCVMCVCIADKLTGKALPVRAHYTSIHECDGQIKKKSLHAIVKTKQNIIIIIITLIIIVLNFCIVLTDCTMSRPRLRIF